jgi:hypothetical protein
MSSASEVHVETFVTARAPVVEPHALEDLLAGWADEYVGQLQQVDQWLEMGPLGTGVLVREQAYAPTCIIHVQRPRRAGLGREDNRVVPLALDSAGLPLLPSPWSSAPVLVRVGRAREIWLLDSVRVYLDQVEDAGIFVTIESVIDPDHPEALATQAARDTLVRLGVGEAELLGKNYAEIVLSARNSGVQAPLSPEDEALRARNSAEVEKRLAKLRAMAPPDGGPDEVA